MVIFLIQVTWIAMSRQSLFRLQGHSLVIHTAYSNPHFLCKGAILMGFINTKKLYFIPLFLLVCSPVLAEPTIATKYNFYSIYPQKKQDLEREMTERSPIIFKGKKFKGYTKWYVEWRIRWLENQGSCKITQVKTALTVTYTLPKIPKDYKTPGETRTIFNNFYAALFKHEQNHRDSGLYAARDIEQALLNLGSFPNPHSAGNRMSKYT
jgi:predicted secreted Zn-dependent protease